jgi:Cu(I)/Ag(I) efflux system protein CusF
MKAVGIAAVFALTATAVLAQPSGMSGMGMKSDQGMEMKGDMKGMDMKGSGGVSKAPQAHGNHRAVGVVKKADRQAGTVTLAHEPVKTMNWPAMTMTFQVKDKAMLDKLAEGKKVEVEFEERGKEHVITGVK